MPDPAAQYTVLARRFRPQAFSEVVGQEHVGQAIQNAIRTNRVAHAYLFTGARGVGKTSTARIFAKALNCPNVQDGVPCNECDVCERIGAGSDVDVIEIDGASNRGIDDIRQLRSNVNVRSMRSPNKVYIIDEVHMLTKEAFNALLKTLEEPPPNVKFVFCTTEPNKLPDTILSRCQRFDFGTIAPESIAQRLREIARAEGREVDEEAIELVARRAAGSMRDSQSLFDQLLAFGGDRISAADVHQLLGTAPDDRMIDLVEALVANAPSTALALIDASLLDGVQLGSFSDQLLAYLRDLLVCAAGAKGVPLSAVTESARPRVEDQSSRWGLTSITAAMQILAEAKVRMKNLPQARALVELAIVRMATLEQLDNIAALVRQVTSGGMGPASAPAGVPGAGGAPAGPKSQAMREAFAKKKTVDPPQGAERAIEKSNSAAPQPEPPPVPVARAVEHPPPTTALAVDTPVVTPAKPEPPLALPPAAAPPVTTTVLGLSEAILPELWTGLLAKVPETLRPHLQNSSRRAISGPNRLDILFPKSYLFSKRYCERSETRSRLEELASGIAGGKLECRLGVDESAVPATNPKAQPKPLQAQRLRSSAVDGDEFVQRALSIFGGQVVEVKTILESPVAVAGPDDTSEE